MKNCFEFINCDLCGPCNESRYFLTIVDDFSLTWVYLLNFKSDTCNALENFYVIIKTKFESKIKIVRINNGASLIRNDLS